MVNRVGMIGALLGALSVVMLSGIMAANSLAGSGPNARNGADDPAGDNRGVDPVRVQGGSDDPAGDNHGVDPVRVQGGSDDPAGHVGGGHGTDNPPGHA